ncbi:YggT family protein [Cohnella faecalis]|uniref:YggT family protein n=1 Tax=Cohnella faecalis TaxID=2315694 RepID=A0A398CZZ1_9BACL|nr:YggT family protein [Cohnella faecalis]RIE04484.1 YggT family protein [Cohnella faecalis]
MADIASFIYLIESIYFYMILIYVLMSWLPSVRESFVGEFLGKAVEPYLKPFRRLIPPIGGMLDISPIVALIALKFVASGLVAVFDFFID